VLLERDGNRILFGQDIHGPFMPQFNSDLDEWRTSMLKLLKLKCDILCEGHFGVIEPEDSVAAFIKQHLRSNT
jgi:glyoxylase-like metal-dependent hydrolase (beta-lactamase superfamily II)